MKRIIVSVALTFGPSAFAASISPLSAKIAEARLDLAALLIQSLDEGSVCETYAYPDDIVATVAGGFDMANDRQKRRFLRKVAPTSMIRMNFAFRAAVGQADFYTNDIDSLRRSLEGSKFFHFGAGAYGSQYHVVLERNGVANEETLELLDDAPWYRWISSQTTWSLLPNPSALGASRFLLQVGDRTFQLEYLGSGEMVWIPVGVDRESSEYFRFSLTTSESYCEA